MKKDPIGAGLYNARRESGIKKGHEVPRKETRRRAGYA
jgi:hypothetical protein